MTSHGQSDPAARDGARRGEHVWAQAVLSAAADGEQDDQVALRAAHRHADTCAPCRSFRDALADPRLVRTGVTTARSTHLVPPPPALRAALWVFAVINVLAGLPLLLHLGDGGLGGAAPSHLTRDGALAVMLGVIAGVVAHQPRRARAFSFVVLAILVLNVIAGSADVARGAVTAGFETLHLVNGITVALVLACGWVTRPTVRFR